MALVATVDGSALPNRIRLRGAGESGFGATSAADGTGSTGGWIFDDPDGDLSLRGWMTATLDETACTSAPRVATGFIGDRTYSRGRYRDGPSREIDCTIVDQNTLMSWLLITEPDGKRPAETHNERIDWLLASSYIPGGLITDLGLVDASHPRPFPATDYRGKFPSEVLSDLAGPIFKTWFVYWDQTAEALGLFFDDPAATTNTSTLTFSNDPSDWDAPDGLSGTCRRVYIDGSLAVDPANVIAKARQVYRNGVVIENNPATAALFFGSLGYRGAEFDNDRNGLESTARAQLDAILTKNSKEEEVLTFTTQLDAASVGLIDAGQRTQVKFTHLPGLETFTYTRVERRVTVQTEGRRDFYDVQLTCSLRGLTTVGGGGDPGIFPAPSPSCGWTLVQQGTPGHVTSLPVAPTPGNKLVILCAERSIGTFVHPVYTGFHEDEYTQVVDPDGGLNLIYSKTSDGSEQDLSTIETTSSLKRYVWYQEWTNNGALGSHSNHNQASAGIIGSTAVTLGAHSLVFVMADQAQGSMSIAINGGFGLTTIGQSDIEAGDSGPHTVAGYNADSTAGSYNPTFTPSNTGFARPQASLIVEYVCDSSSNPPLSGQWVYDEIPTPAPDGSTVTFTLSGGYVAGSLRVKVDGVPIINGLTETDPLAGTFTLDFAPLGAQGDTRAEIVTATYQSI